MIKTIVFIDFSSSLKEQRPIKHSAWMDEIKAQKQVDILNEAGYKAYYERIDHNYENGHYFI